jgi:DNA-directed RNA polymerase specialized sigma24 family protein
LVRQRDRLRGYGTATACNLSAPASVVRETAFEEFVHRWQAVLFRAAFLMTGDRHLAEDLVQSALERTYQHWRRVANAGNADAYVRRIMVNLANDRWRSRRHVIEQSLDAAVATPSERDGHAEYAQLLGMALFVDWLELPAPERNELWWMFTDPRARDVYANWEKDASAMLARFRLSAARRPDDPGFAELIERLHEHSAEVRAWWPRHEVLAPSSGIRHLRHPLPGAVTFQHVVLQVADHPDQKLVTFETAGHERDLARMAATVR